MLKTPSLQARFGGRPRPRAARESLERTSVLASGPRARRGALPPDREGRRLLVRRDHGAVQLPGEHRAGAGQPVGLAARPGDARQAAPTGELVEALLHPDAKRRLLLPLLVAGRIPRLVETRAAQREHAGLWANDDGGRPEPRGKHGGVRPRATSAASSAEDMGASRGRSPRTCGAAIRGLSLRVDGSGGVANDGVASARGWICAPSSRASLRWCAPSGSERLPERRLRARHRRLRPPLPLAGGAQRHQQSATRPRARHRRSNQLVDPACDEASAGRAPPRRHHPAPCDPAGRRG